MRKLNWEYGLLAGIFAVYLGICAYQLRALPAEWYGDISIEHREVLAILSGSWPWRFNLSAGPAYHYVVAAFALLLGPNYMTYKIASVVTGMVTIALLYLLGKELAGRWAGLLAAAVGAVSFWLMVFARLGSSPQILSPVLATGAVYFLVRFSRTHRWSDLVISIIFAGIGLFNYPATFILPPLILMLIAWQWLVSKQRALWGRALLLTLGVLLPFVLILGYMARMNPAFTSSGYVGTKVVNQHIPPQQLVITFGENMIKALGMFQWTGDHAFRTNVSKDPLMDPLSGILMDLGLAWLFLNPRLRQHWGFILLPVVIQLIPSASPGLPSIEIPSTSRTLGAAPFVFLLIAMGMNAVWVLSRELLERRAIILNWIRNLFRPSAAADPAAMPIAVTGADQMEKPGLRTSLISSIFVGVILIAIGYFNISRYFGPYAWGLPEHNQPWGLEIAHYIDSLPAHVQVKLAACCWGDWKDPDAESIFYVLQHPQGRESLLKDKFTTRCDALLPGEDYALIFPPNDKSILVNTFRGCFPQAEGKMHYDPMGQPAFFSLEITQSLITR